MIMMTYDLIMIMILMTMMMRLHLHQSFNLSNIVVQHCLVHLQMS